MSCPPQSRLLRQCYISLAVCHLLQGCLVSGPSGSSTSDVYQDSRKVSDMAVVLENTAAWQSLAAGGSPQFLHPMQSPVAMLPQGEGVM